jgi:hypothetical protein
VVVSASQRDNIAAPAPTGGQASTLRMTLWSWGPARQINSPARMPSAIEILEISVIVTAALLSAPMSWVTPSRPREPSTNNQNRVAAVPRRAACEVAAIAPTSRTSLHTAAESGCIAFEYRIGDDLTGVGEDQNYPPRPRRGTTRRNGAIDSNRAEAASRADIRIGLAITAVR